MIKPLQESSRFAYVSDRRTERTSIDENLQTSFTAVLQEVGRQGYLSAEPVANADSVEQNAQRSWEGWFNAFGRDAYSDYIDHAPSHLTEGKLTADDLIHGYQQIIGQAYRNGGYANPKEFVATLSQKELKTIQLVQRLADPIEPSSLSNEGALNLLIPPPAHVDESGDGITQVGRANVLRFPDSNTPRSVRDAWNQATEGLSDQERMHFSFQVVSQIGLANMHFDAEGNFIRSAEPGDPDWINPFATKDFTYSKLATQWLSYLDRFRNQMPPEQYLKSHEFWSSFAERLGQREISSELVR